MQRILDIRITRWYLKLAFVVAAWLVGFPFIALFNAMNAPSWVGNIADSLLTIGAVVLGARLFRGRGEPVEPRRPWWKFTAWPRLSRVLGIVFACVVVSILISFIAAALGVERAIQSIERITVPDNIVNGVFYSILAFLYLNSASRMKGMVPPGREPKLKQRIKLD
jgi:hypothetical protein